MVRRDMFCPVVRAVRVNPALEQIILTSPADFLPPMLQRLYPLTQVRARHPEPRLTEKELHQDEMLRTMRAMLESHTKVGIEVFNLPTQASGADWSVLQSTGVMTRPP